MSQKIYQSLLSGFLFLMLSPMGICAQSEDHQLPKIPLKVGKVASQNQAAAAGIEPGDLLFGWRIQGQTKISPILSPLLLEDMERNTVFVFDVEFIGSRDGQDRTWPVKSGRHNFTLVPVWPDLWSEKIAAIEAAEPMARVDLARHVALELKDSGYPELAGYLILSTWEKGAEVIDKQVMLDQLKALVEVFPTDGEPLLFRAFMSSVIEGGMYLEAFEWVKDQVERAMKSDLAQGDSLWMANLTLGRARLADVLAPETSLGFYDELVRLQEQVSPNTLVLANRYAQRGIYYYKQRNLAKVAEDWTTALEMRVALLPGSMDVAKSHNNLGSVFWYLGDLDQAAHHFEGAMAIFSSRLPDGIGTGNGFNNLGLVHHNRGDLAKAESFYLHAINIYRNHEHGPDMLPLPLMNLGHLMRDRGKLVEAEALLLESQNMLSSGEKDPMLEPTLLGNLSQIASIRGDLDQARTYLEASAAMIRVRAPESADMAEALGALAQVLVEQGHQNQAIKALQEAMELHQKHDPDSLNHANHLASLAEVVWQKGDPEKAQSYLEKSLSIFQAKAPGCPHHADSLALKGQMACASGLPGHGKEQFDQALAIFRDLTPGTWSLAQTLHKYALCLRGQGQAMAAIEALQEAVNVLDEQQKSLGGGSDAGVLFRASFMTLYQDLESLLLEANRGKEAFHILERSRARQFLSMLTERDLLFDKDVPKALDEKRRQLHYQHDQALKALAELNRDTPEQEKNQAKEKVAQIKKEHKDLVESIRQASPRLAALRYPQPLQANQALAIIRPGDCLLAYSVGEEQTRLYVLGPEPESFSAHVLPVGREKWRVLAENFRAIQPGALPGSDRTQNPQDLAGISTLLSELLLSPAKNQLAKANRLVVSADGPLHIIPFAGLRDPADEQHFTYLIERLPVSLVQSTTVLAELRSHQKSALNGGAVFADPDYSGSELAGSALAPLPWTRREATLIKEIQPRDTQMFVGEKASEAKAKEVGGQVGWVHFACHGIIDPESPLDSGLALTNPGRINAPGDNGLLQAWEIFEGIRFKADLVTLSACETGLGPLLQGEGLNSLSRAFQYAGARAVMASLWRVEDRSTQSLMARFYQEMDDGVPMDEALRRAQVSLLRGGKNKAPSSSPPTEGYGHPFYWAAFQIMGDAAR